jgi:hypothetical protein
MAVPGDNQFIEVSRLLRGEPLQAKMVQDKEIGIEEGMGGLLPRESVLYVGRRSSELGVRVA